MVASAGCDCWSYHVHGLAKAFQWPVGNLFPVRSQVAWCMPGLQLHQEMSVVRILAFAVGCGCSSGSSNPWVGVVLAMWCQIQEAVSGEPRSELWSPGHLLGESVFAGKLPATSPVVEKALLASSALLVSGGAASAGCYGMSALVSPLRKTLCISTALLSSSSSSFTASRQNDKCGGKTQQNHHPKTGLEWLFVCCMLYVQENLHHVFPKRVWITCLVLVWEKTVITGIGTPARPVILPNCFCKKYSRNTAGCVEGSVCLPLPWVKVIHDQSMKRAVMNCHVLPWVIVCHGQDCKLLHANVISRLTFLCTLCRSRGTKQKGQ